MSLLDRTVAYLESRGTRAALIGAAAAAAHGVSRATQDLDLLTLDASVLDQPFWTEFKRSRARSKSVMETRTIHCAGWSACAGAGAEIVDIIVGRFYWHVRRSIAPKLCRLRTAASGWSSSSTSFC